MVATNNKLINIFYGGFLHMGGGAYTHAQLLANALKELDYHVALYKLDDLPILIKYLPHCMLRLFNFIIPGYGFIVKGNTIRLLYNIFLRKPSFIDIYEDIYIAPKNQLNAITVLHALWTDNLQSHDLNRDSVNKLLNAEYEKINTLRHPLVTVSIQYSNYLRNSHFSPRLIKALNVVELGIDLNEVQSYKTLKSIPNDFHSLCFCGSLEPRKNLPFLLEILKLLVLKDPLFRLVIVGDGPLRDYLVTFSRAHHLPVTFTGKLNRTKMLETISRQDIMVHTSTKESFSLALLEAKVLGLYTIAHSSLEVPSKFVDIRMNDYNPSSWARRITSFTPNQYPESDLSHYSSIRMAQETLQLLNGALDP